MRKSMNLTTLPQKEISTEMLYGQQQINQQQQKPFHFLLAKERFILTHDFCAFSKWSR